MARETSRRWSVSMTNENIPILWHFRLSHFNEKVRWALDYKKIEHRKVDWPPGMQIGPALLRTGQRRLPIMCIDGDWIHDSTAIIERLEQRHPFPPLYPEDRELRREALDWEEELDTDLGPATRSLVLNAAMRQPDAVVREAARFKPPLFDLGLRMMTPGLRIAGAAAGAFGFPTRRSRDTVEGCLEKIEARIEDRQYLVGDEFTIADLTAAALLSPIMEVDEFPYEPDSGFPSPVDDLREEFSSRPAITWGKSMYRRHRRSASR
jgi:glutathione S-transferase